MSMIQRGKSDHLIIGHGRYEKTHKNYPQFKLERDIKLYLIAVPGALVRIRLGQALVDHLQCQLHLKRNTTNEIVDAQYTIKAYQNKDQIPNYQLSYVDEIYTNGDETVHMPNNDGTAVCLEQLITQLPQDAKVVYVACCACMTHKQEQQFYSVDYS